MSLVRRAIDVLIVDDDRDTADTIAETLVAQNYTVKIEENGLDALNFLQRNPAPHLMMLDLFMPRMGGVELLSYQDGSKWKDTKVVVVSALDPVETPVTFKGDVLKKPFSLIELLKVVHKHTRAIK